MAKIKTLYDLQLHKAKLTMELAQQETQLETKWSYIRVHFKSLIWQQVNPFKNKQVAVSLLSALEPGLLPVIADIAVGAGKGKPLNGKVLLSSVKYILATLGIKWLKKLIQNEPDQEQDLANTDDSNLNSTQTI